MALHNFILTEPSYDTGAKERSGRNKMAGNKSSCPDVSAPDVSACDVSLLPVSDISSEFFCVYDDVMGIIINSSRKDPTLLSRRKRDSSSDLYRIPNTVHYVWFGKIEFTFVNYLSLLSVDKFIKPDYIFIHGDSIPGGEWWNRTTSEVPNIYHVEMECPWMAPNGQRFKWIQHVSDYIRVKTISGMYTSISNIRSWLASMSYISRCSWPYHFSGVSCQHMLFIVWCNRGDLP